MPYKDFTVKDFSEGMVDKTEDNFNLPDGASPDCSNYISMYPGLLQKRPGQSRLNSVVLGGTCQGLHSYYYGTTPTRRMVAAYNGKIAYWDYDAGTPAFVEIATGLDTSALVKFENCINYMVYCNGVDPPRKWDGTTDSALANAPADAQFFCYHKEQLFCVDKSYPNRLRWSNLINPEDWPGVNYWDISPGDGDEITNLVRLPDGLVIFKKYSTSVLYGSTLDDFQLVQVDSRVGCSGPFAACVDQGVIYFIAHDGIYARTVSGAATNLTKDRIPRLWDTVNKEFLHLAAIVSFNNIVRACVLEGNDGYDSLSYWDTASYFLSTGLGIYIYDNKVWPQRGVFANCFTIYDSGPIKTLYSGNLIDEYVDIQDTGTDDWGQNIPYWWESWQFDYGTAEREKKCKKIFVEDTASSTATIAAATDYDSTYTDLTLRRTDGRLREFRGPSTRWRYISIKMYGSDKVAATCRGIMARVKAKNKPRA